MNELLENAFQKHFTFRRDNLWTISTLEGSITESIWNDVTLISFKEQMNSVKSLLNRMEPSEWRRHTTYTSIGGRVIPHLQKVIQPELLTQAWCKFWEIVNTYEIVQTENKLSSIHLCEAPGAFITALNHYLKLNHQSLCWNWIANTLNPYYEGNSTGSAVLDDRFIFHTFDHWQFGKLNTGNILDKQIVIDFQETIGNEHVHLITADGSVDCQDVPDEQENVVLKLFLAETYTALHLLTSNGCFVIKMFTFFEAQTVSLLYVLNLVFKIVHVFKPVTSKPGNSEVYLVCIGYIGRKLAEHAISCIGKMMNDGVSLLKKDSVPQTFLTQVIECSKLFTHFQIEAIKLNLKAYEEMTDSCKKELNRLKQYCAEEFVNRYNLKPIQNFQKIAPGLSMEGETMLFQYSQKSGNLSYADRQAMKSSWQRRLGYIRALVRDTRKHVDFNTEFSNTKTIENSLLTLLPGCVTLGAQVNKICSSLFCPAQLLIAWNELQERQERSGYTLPSDEGRQWVDTVLIEIQELKACKFRCWSVVSQGITILSADSSRQEFNLPIELKMDESEPSSLSSKTSHETERAFQKRLVKNILIWLYCSNPDDTVLLQLHSSYTRFTAGILFLLASLFRMVRVKQPPVNNPTSSQTWCFLGFCPNKSLNTIFNHLWRVFIYLCKSDIENKVVLELVPINVLCKHEFYMFLVNISTSALLNKVWFLSNKLLF